MIEGPHPNTQVKLIEDNYEYVVNEEATFKYDYNFLTFKTMPTIAMFEDALAQVEKVRITDAIKVRFPQNQYLSPEIWQYAVSNEYDFGQMILYFIEKKEFESSITNVDVVVEKVTSESLPAYLDFFEKADQEFGKQYAEKNRGLMEREFSEEEMTYYIARIKDKVVGSLRMINHGMYEKQGYKNFGFWTEIQKVIK